MIFTRSSILLILCIGFLSISLSRGQDSTVQELVAIKAEVQKIIDYDTDISFEDIPGIIMAIVDEDETYLMGFGKYNELGEDSLSMALFEIGGLTKVFTAHLGKILLEENRIKTSATLAELDLDLPTSLDQITLKQLLTHTSGLPSLPTDLGKYEEHLKSRYANYRKQDLIGYLEHVEINPRKQNKYSHSHINYALLEIILERITGTAYAELMQEYVFGPFEMKSSQFKNSVQMEAGFNRAGRQVKPWEFASFSGSEGMRASLKDLAIYVQLNLDPSQEYNFEGLLQAHAKIPNARKSWVADAWHLFRNRNYFDIYLHSGKTTGHGANIQFLPETRTGVIIMVNSPGSLSGLGMLVLRMINDNWKRKVNGEEK